MKVTIRCITDANGHWLNAEDLVDALQMRQASFESHLICPTSNDLSRGFEVGYLIEVLRAACPPTSDVDDAKDIE